LRTSENIFDKFWRPTNLTFNLGNLNLGTYKLQLVLKDEGEHVTTDEIIISISQSKSTSTIPIGMNSFLLGLMILILWRKKNQIK